MNKPIVSMVLVLVVSSIIGGCATTQVSPDQVITPPGAPVGTQWKISAKSDSGTLSDDLTLYINGTPVATGSVSLTSQQTLLTGNYDNHPVQASCAAQVKAGWASHECKVLVDGKPVATLDF